MHGLHLTADLYRCHCEDAWLTDASRLGAWCQAAASAAGLQPLAEVAQAGAASSAGGTDAAQGVAAALLLADAHLCIHTWPQARGVTADVFVGDASGEHAARARQLVDAIVARFQPEWTEQRSLDRGGEQA